MGASKVQEAAQSSNVDQVCPALEDMSACLCNLAAVCWAFDDCCPALLHRTVIHHANSSKPGAVSTSRHCQLQV